METAYKLGCIIGKYPILEIFSYYGYPRDVMKILFATSRSMRNLVIIDYDAIDRMVVRDTFKVNNVTKLLSS